MTGSFRTQRRALVLRAIQFVTFLPVVPDGLRALEPFGYDADAHRVGCELIYPVFRGMHRGAIDVSPQELVGCERLCEWLGRWTLIAAIYICDPTDRALLGLDDGFVEISGVVGADTSDTDSPTTVN